MLKANVIRESKSPYNFPIIVIPKKDGSKRICVDFRKLNEVTVSDPYPIPRIDDILNKLSGSVIFSTLDLKSGYWQIPLTEEAARMTAFSTERGRFEFIKLPFGLKNAPNQFSRIMSNIFNDLEFVQVYIDDIIIHSKSVEEHLKHLELVFQRFESVEMKLNQGKCKIGQEKISVLGHVVANNSIEMDKEKVKSQ